MIKLDLDSTKSYIRGHSIFPSDRLVSMIRERITSENVKISTERKDGWYFVDSSDLIYKWRQKCWNGNLFYPIEIFIGNEKISIPRAGSILPIDDYLGPSLRPGSDLMWITYVYKILVICKEDNYFLVVIEKISSKKISISENLNSFYLTNQECESFLFDGYDFIEYIRKLSLDL